MPSGDNDTCAKHDALEQRVDLMANDFSEQKKETARVLREILAELKALRETYSEHRGDLRERLVRTEGEAKAANRRLNGFEKGKTREDEKVDESLSDMQKAINSVIFKTAAITSGSTLTVMGMILGILFVTGVIGG